MSNLSAKLEFEVKDLDSRSDDLENIKENLLKTKGITSATINKSDNKVYVETDLPSSIIQRYIENEFNSAAILRGMGAGNWSKGKYETTAAVSIISNYDELIKPIRGVVRFVQLDENNCAIDGTIDGIKTGLHSINVCEYGDLTKGCESTGPIYNPYNKKHGLSGDKERHAGDLGNVNADTNDVATFRLVNQQLKVWDIIGRSFCVYERHDTGNGDCGKKIACGIIARSAGLFENMKKICSCSGKTLWEERDIITRTSKF